MCRRFSGRRHAGLALLCSLILTGLSPAPSVAQGPLQVHVADTGPALCTITATPQERVFVYDTGTGTEATAWPPRFDLASSRPIPSRRPPWRCSSRARRATRRLRGRLRPPPSPSATAPG